ncbi:4-hydroxythreonine-4-phosphate dehydrogenase PdxA [Prochlorococcus sp. MIT 1341]|uniref:4-hydroxythreonine-4-phosphate dehydrogenase PdxA n=1 Tax=Prochlorococcus sp. MIT 1341 TaxID=3096221 RepID=UPI002A753720|nr:4-hydroxythreonine-4-phosphate dehydrogenase PdxA [Prochlorococcus sp. MIT 1341]
MAKKDQYLNATKNLIIALGDPAGIGMEITLKALASRKLPPGIIPLLVGCKKTLIATHQNLKEKGIGPLPNIQDIEIDDIPLTEEFKPGYPSAATGDASFEWLTRATEYVLDKKAKALVTAPICKHAWHAAGHFYPGQTERLAELAKTNQASMLFTAKSPYCNWRFNTLLATTHIPISQISTKLTPQLISSKLDILLNFCKNFKDKPTLSVAGLNPHAGENGSLGDEEIKWLTPLLREWSCQHPTINLIGPIAPDSCWLSAAEAWRKGQTSHTPDGFLALYHDQGLIPMKLLAFDTAVNLTLELPFIRTSPDHGTGFDIASKGCAREESMLAAIQTAWELKK